MGGTIVAVTNGSGDVTKRYAYTPYGQMEASGTDDVHQPWRFAGSYYDKDLDLYHMGARYYDPDLLQFTQMDPMMGKLHDPTTLNAYLYAAGDPINNTDPSGAVTCPTWLSSTASALNPISSFVGFGATLGTSFSFSFLAAQNATSQWATVASTASRASLWIGVGALAVDLVCD